MHAHTTHPPLNGLAKPWQWRWLRAATAKTHDRAGYLQATHDVEPALWNAPNQPLMHTTCWRLGTVSVKPSNHPAAAMACRPVLCASPCDTCQPKQPHPLQACGNRELLACVRPSCRSFSPVDSPPASGHNHTPKVCTDCPNTPCHCCTRPGVRPCAASQAEIRSATWAHCQRRRPGVGGEPPHHTCSLVEWRAQHM